jgi:hypothetical protein
LKPLNCGLGIMHQAKLIEFERMATEFAAWRAVEDEQRSPAASWWWGPAMALRHQRDPLPPQDCRRFALPQGASFADAADKVMAHLASQRSLASAADFPRRRRRSHDDAATARLAMAAE